MPSLLIVEDEAAHLEVLKRVFRRENVDVSGVSSGKEALDLVRKSHFDVVLTDLVMPGMSGLDLLRTTRRLSPDSEVIVMSAFGTIELAVEAMREGAYDFLTKPIKRAQVLKAARRAFEKQALVAENRSLRAQLAEVALGQQIIGNSPALRSALSLLRQAAPSEATVMLRGESGTGKELFARSLHSLSPRQSQPMVAIDCGALPRSIVEAELFGYERGAFTGADRRKIGRIQAAHQGTLFLDEIGELDIAVQAKLLRVLQEGEVMALGTTRPRHVDVRVVTATHRDLEEAVKQGTFREDLYYRLNVIQIEIPPLRARSSDVPLLAEHFRMALNQKNRKQARAFTRTALQALSQYHWPGNVRELANVIERAVVLDVDDLIGVDDLPGSLVQSPTTPRSISLPLGISLEEAERRLIHETLALTDGNKRMAAQILGIATRTIYRKLADDSG